MSLTVTAISAQRQEKDFDLYEMLISSIKQNGFELQNGDIVVISSKYVSYSQGRVIHPDSIKPSKRAQVIAKKFQLKPNVAEIIIRESDVVFGGIAGFVITSCDNIMAPNAGIDKSNSKNGNIILYPKHPYNIAEELRRKIFFDFSIHVGIIIVDSRLMPSRVGTIGIAIACAGIEPVLDKRAQKDLDGKPLKVTFQAVVDNFASIANHQMGEGAESKPIALIRNSNARLTDRRILPNEMAISYDQCVYVRGLKNYQEI